MRQGYRVSRRELLQTAMVAGAAGLGRGLQAEASTAKPFVDTHVYLGHWPHAYLGVSDAPALIVLLRQHKITQAFAGSFDGLFHKDIAGVNERLAEECASAGDAFLVPFGTINPTLPDWEDDVRRCHQQHRMRGIRLHPNYHGYALDDSRFGRLLELAVERGLLVQLVAWLEDTRHAWLTPKVSRLDVAQLPQVLAKVRGVRMVVSGAVGIVDGTTLDGLLKSSDVYFDQAGPDSKKASRRPLDHWDPNRLVFGSGAPLRTVAEAVSEAETSSLRGVDVLRPD